MKTAKAVAAQNSDAKAVTAQRNTVNNPELNYLIIFLCDLFGSRIERIKVEDKITSGW